MQSVDQLRDYSQISDASVSRITSALEAAGYLKVRKGYIGKRPRTWLSLTPMGRTALARHLAALQTIADTAQEAGDQAEGTAETRRHH
ncbi:transcriptional regulator [Streptomyces sp. NPDC055966]|uniref:transcriptional regulator n=1 Tax=Streptomyces sp. NPDC055966 TaxID=3345669 RepID=UPI0035DD3E35